MTANGFTQMTLSMASTCTKFCFMQIGSLLIRIWAYIGIR